MGRPLKEFVKCSVSDCIRASRSKGMCELHYRRSCRTGVPLNAPVGAYPAANLRGRQFGMLVVTGREGTLRRGRMSAATWTCQCKCGNICVRTSGSLISGAKKHSIQNCGCSTRKIQSFRSRRRWEALKVKRDAYVNGWDKP